MTALDQKRKSQARHSSPHAFVQPVRLSISRLQMPVFCQPVADNASNGFRASERSIWIGVSVSRKGVDAIKLGPLEPYPNLFAIHRRAAHLTFCIHKV